LTQIIANDSHLFENPAMSSVPTSLFPTGPVRSLSSLNLHETAQVQGVDPAAGGQPGERAQQLADIGFTPGERVSVVARAWPGGDPLVVRVGQSRFALRKAEADCILVQP
jgi:ferrous iron transport protein A